MPWGVVYYRTADGRVPADEFLDRCPDKVEETILAVGHLFSDADYRRHVRRPAGDYLSTLSRRIAT